MLLARLVREFETVYENASSPLKHGRDRQHALLELESTYDCGRVGG